MKTSIRDRFIFSGLMFVALSVSVPLWLFLFESGFNLGAYKDLHFWGWILVVTGLGTVVFWVMKTSL